MLVGKEVLAVLLIFDGLDEAVQNLDDHARMIDCKKNVIISRPDGNQPMLILGQPKVRYFCRVA